MRMCTERQNYQADLRYIYLTLEWHKSVRFMASITLYDIPSTLRPSGRDAETDERQAWSPNTWKTRYMDPSL